MHVVAFRSALTWIKRGVGLANGHLFQSGVRMPVRTMAIGAIVPGARLS
jgi:hypothetical protein